MCARHLFALVCWAVAPMLGWTAEPSLREQLTSCAAVASEVDRLACFEAVAAALSPEDPPGPSVETEDDEERRFGEESLRRDGAAAPAGEVSSIAASIERLVQRPFGEHVFHLSNGQVWTEIEAGRGRYREGTPVTIERTTFGGYVLSTGSGQATRVRRVQ